MKFDELNKINNFIYFLEDEKLWENFNISYYDMLETNSENFFNEINNNVFGKSKLEKNDIISQFVFELYNNMVILDNFKKNNPKYNSTEYKFLSEIYESSINSIVYVCFKNGFDFVQIILNLKLKLYSRPLSREICFSIFQTSPSRKFLANTPSDSLKLQILAAIKLHDHRKTA